MPVLPRTIKLEGIFIINNSTDPDRITDREDYSQTGFSPATATK